MAQHPVYTAVVANQKFEVDKVNNHFFKLDKFDRRTQLPRVTLVQNATSVKSSDVLYRLSNFVNQDQQVSGQIKGLAEINIKGSAEQSVPEHLYNYSSTSKVAAVLLNNM